MQAVRFHEYLQALETDDLTLLHQVLENVFNTALEIAVEDVRKMDIPIGEGLTHMLDSTLLFNPDTNNVCEMVVFELSRRHVAYTVPYRTKNIEGEQ